MMVKKICLRQGIGSFMAEAATSILDTSYVSVSGIMDSWGDVSHDQGSARSIKNRYDPFTNFLGILLAGGYRSMNMVQDVTGYMISSLEILWSSAKPHFEKYPAHDGTLHTRTREKWRAQHYFYVFLM